ncbi:MAG: FHA domain-containing protein [Bacteroidetes bacterium]|nr:MAG: FHA domain-containing protein [Bacteroidota bacterium]
MTTYLIGRHKECDIVLDDGKKSVSRRHAILRIHPDRSCTIEDCDSTNQTLVNQRALKPHQPFYLHAGDEVMLAGKVPLQWEEYLHAGRGRTAPLRNEATRVLQPGEEQPAGGQPPRRQPTVLTYTVVGDFLDRILPIPGLTKNIRLFFNLHLRPVSKILQLIKQPEAEAEAHPFSFLGFAFVFYFGVVALMSSKLESQGAGQDSQDDLGLLKAFVDYPVLASVYVAVVVLAYAWVAYHIFKRVAPKPQSFQQFLKLTSLSQGMILIHTTLLVFILILVATKADTIGSNMMAVVVALLLLELVMIVYFMVVNIRSMRKFWEMSWGRYLPYFFLLGLLTLIISYLLEYVFMGIVA